MRISDWSSDVCSSDLRPGRRATTGRAKMQVRIGIFAVGAVVGPRLTLDHDIARRHIGPEDAVRKAERAIALREFLGRLGELHRDGAAVAGGVPGHSTVTDFARLRG